MRSDSIRPAWRYRVLPRRLPPRRHPRPLPRRALPPPPHAPAPLAHAPNAPRTRSPALESGSIRPGRRAEQPAPTRGRAPQARQAFSPRPMAQRSSCASGSRPRLPVVGCRTSEASNVQSPYRSASRPITTDDEQEASELVGLIALVVLLGVFIVCLAPQERSSDPEPRGEAAHGGGGQVHHGGRR
jgi:hypothetical protein